jgi:hypothetical protein
MIATHEITHGIGPGLVVVTDDGSEQASASTREGGRQSHGRTGIGVVLIGSGSAIGRARPSLALGRGRANGRWVRATTLNHVGVHADDLDDPLGRATRLSPNVQLRP